MLMALNMCKPVSLRVPTANLNSRIARPLKRKPLHLKHRSKELSSSVMELRLFQLFIQSLDFDKKRESSSRPRKTIIKIFRASKSATIIEMKRCIEFSMERVSADDFGLEGLGTEGEILLKQNRMRSLCTLLSDHVA